MDIDRRAVLALSLAAVVTPAFAQGVATAGLPPVLFVHGNGDSAALWQTLVWRLESNGFDRTRLFAFNFTDPTARDDDTKDQHNRSSAADQARELTAQIDIVLAKTGAAQIALVGSSRGGYAIRNVLTQDGMAAKISHAVLCGTPNHGVFAFDAMRGSEFNGSGALLTRLNSLPDEITAGPRWMTIRSDGFDKYAQSDGAFIGRPGVPTGVTSAGPELKGAVNVVLSALDHRETAFGPGAFREIFRFVTGREPDRIAIATEGSVEISGLVTALADGVATNRPLAGALVQVFALSPDTAARIGEPVYEVRTDASGAWGPAMPPVGMPVEFVVTADGYPVTHIYRGAFPRSTTLMHLRPGRPLAGSDKEVGAVATMSRPRGYFGRPRDAVTFDGKEPMDIKAGVPTDSTTVLRLPDVPARPIAGTFNDERVVCRAWPARDNHLTIAELTY